MILYDSGSKQPINRICGHPNQGQDGWDTEHAQGDYNYMYKCDQKVKIKLRLLYSPWKEPTVPAE
jgi:hypothetical protein